MSAHEPFDEELAAADSWSESVTDALERSRNMAWIVACVSLAIAFILAAALIILLPLKEREPYTLLVDRQTGNVEALAPFGEQQIATDEALTRSFLVQYVTARESYDYNDVTRDYRKVGLWSAGEARERYEDLMQSSAPSSPVNRFEQNTRVSTEVRSVSSLAEGRSLVRFSTIRSGRGNSSRQVQNWAAVIDHTYSDAPMSEEDRYLNPLGFQVTRYRRDPETLPETDTPAPSPMADLLSPRRSTASEGTADDAVNGEPME